MKKKESPKWIPFWVDKWIWGSTRLELKPDEQSVWIDFLALAAKDDGWIRANEGIPYPIQQLAGVLCKDASLIERTIKRCLETKKLIIMNDNTLYLTNWDEYKFSDRYLRKIKKNKTIHNNTGVPKNGTEFLESGTDSFNSLIQLVYNFYIWGFSKNPKTYQLTDKRIQKIKKRLEEFEDPKYLLWAVYSISQSSFHLGENEDKKKYIELDEHIFRSQERTERWVREFEEKKYHQAFERAFNKFREREK